MTNIECIIEMMQEAGFSLDPITTGTVLSYELGDLNKCAFYATVRSPDLRSAYVDEMRCAAADLVTQLRVMFHTFEIDWEDVIELGERRLYERGQEYLTGLRPQPRSMLHERRQREGD